MKLLGMRKVRDGRYLKGYELTYENKAGREKAYEIVSLKEISDTAQLGERVTGVSIVAYYEDKLLLLKEFRMAVNREIYNLCAGHLEEGETVEECVRRELYEESGLALKRIIKILPPCFSAVTLSDAKTQIAFVEAEGVFEDHTSDNEQIIPNLYTRQQVAALVEKEEFSARAQIVALWFANFGKFLP